MQIKNIWKSYPLTDPDCNLEADNEFENRTGYFRIKIKHISASINTVWSTKEEIRLLFTFLQAVITEVILLCEITT